MKGNSEIEFDKEVSPTTDVIISFIGVTLILLGMLSVFFSIPEVYVVGITMGGLFFVLADLFIMNKKIKKMDLILYVITLFMGVFSFIGLPVFILVFPVLEAWFLKISDFSTFFALGVVLITLSYKSVIKKEKERNLLEAEINELKRKLELLESENIK